MTHHNFRVAFAVPAGLVEAARREAVAEGLGEGCYSIATAPTAASEPTYWMLNGVETGEAFDDLLAVVIADDLPEDRVADLEALLFPDPHTGVPALRMCVVALNAVTAHFYTSDAAAENRGGGGGGGGRP